METDLKEACHSAQSRCCGCDLVITDEFLLKVGDGEWHRGCLRCLRCRRELNEQTNCFIQNNCVFCRDDFIRCHRCDKSFHLDDIVIRIHPFTVYHSSCFRCIGCNRPLSSPPSSLGPGFSPNDFALLPEGPVCRDDYQALASGYGRTLVENGDSSPPSEWKKSQIVREDESTDDGKDEGPKQGQGQGRTVVSPLASDRSDRSESPETFRSNETCRLNDARSDTCRQPPTERKLRHSKDEAHGADECLLLASADERDDPATAKVTARIRTVMNETQLGILRDFYLQNSRPDSTLKDRLAAVTGLTAKVIRVWFQNRRCKEKKKTKNKTFQSNLLHD